MSCLRWFRPPARSTVRNRGCRRAGLEGGLGGDRHCSGGERRGGGRCRSGEAGRGRAGFLTRRRPGVTSPHPARAWEGWAWAERPRSRRRGWSRTVWPGSAGRRATQVQGTQLRKGVPGAQPGAGRLRAAASALPAVPANPVRAPARQPAPLAAAAPLCRPRAHPLGPEAPPPRRRLAGWAASGRSRVPPRRGI